MFYIHPLSSAIEFLPQGGLPTVLLQTGGGVRTRITLCVCFVCTQRKFGIKGMLWPRQDPNLQIGVLIGGINLCALRLSAAWWMQSAGTGRPPAVWWPHCPTGCVLHPSWTRAGRCLLGCSAPTIHTCNSWVPLHVQSGAQKWSSKSSRNSRLGRAQPPPLAPGHHFCKGSPPSSIPRRGCRKDNTWEMYFGVVACFPGALTQGTQGSAPLAVDGAIRLMQHFHSLR